MSSALMQRTVAIGVVAFAFVAGSGTAAFAEPGNDLPPAVTLTATECATPEMPLVPIEAEFSIVPGESLTSLRVNERDISLVTLSIPDLGIGEYGYSYETTNDVNGLVEESVGTLTVSPCLEEFTIIPVPDAPGVVDHPDANGEVVWDLPADTEVLNWELDAEGQLTVVIVDDSVRFEDGTSSASFGTPPVQAEPVVDVVVVPVDPFANGIDANGVALPEVEGVHYELETEYHVGYETLTVTATPLPGYVFEGEQIVVFTWNVVYRDGDEQAAVVRADIIVAPVNPFLERSAGEGFTLPTTQGVRYELDIVEGSEAETWIVTATPLSGYAFVGEQSVTYEQQLAVENAVASSAADEGDSVVTTRSSPFVFAAVVAGVMLIVGISLLVRRRATA